MSADISLGHCCLCQQKSDSLNIKKMTGLITLQMVGVILKKYTVKPFQWNFAEIPTGFLFLTTCFVLYNNLHCLLLYSNYKNK